jgi:PDZ domain-containing protein
MVSREEKLLRSYAANADTAKDSVFKITSGRKERKALKKACFWLDLCGIIIALILIVFGELIWLPDPVRLSPQTYWIEFINELVYLSMLTPFLWSISAVVCLIHIWNLRKIQQYSKPSLRVLGIMRILVLLSSGAAIFCIAFAQDQLVYLILALSIALFTTIICMNLQESLTIRGIPMRSLAVLGLTILLLAALLWPTNYIVTYPGLTMNMNQYAHVEGGESKDQIAGVLIFERPAFPVDWLYAKVFPNYEFAVRQKNEPSLGEQLQQVRTEQLDANQIASAVAFEKTGKGRGAVSHGVKVTGIVKGSAAANQLNLGDIIIQVQGTAITTATELINHIKKAAPGDEITLIVIRNKQNLSMTLRPQADKNDPKKPVLGIQVTDDIQADLPLKVKFHEYLLHVGGPSHGAMLALALIDQLTPGGVTNGNKVAGTGTIDIHGVVGPIGGIQQKAFSVERSGTDVFFIPEEQLKEARRGASQLNIVPVKTIDDILKWLQQHPKRDVR